MRHFKQLFTLFLVFAMTSLMSSGAVKQLQFGRQVVEVGADETVEFTDMNGYTSISGSSSKSHSMTVFKPASGMSIQVTFSNLDVRNDGASWPAYVKVYSGDPDADETFVWATTTSGVTKDTQLPSGNVLATLDGTYTDLTYTSEDATGILSVGFLYCWGKTCNGWKATVKCVKLSDMEVTGASSSYDAVVASPTDSEALAFATATVTAEGMMNADALTAVTFTVPLNENAIDPLSLRLYKGKQPTFKGETALDATVSTAGEGLYAFALNSALSEGENHFTIAGEFLSDAAPGKRAEVEVTAVATAAMPDGVTPFTAGTPVVVTKPAIVLMSTTAQTITVGDIPYNFYDDGGKDANYTQGFEGQITFVPETEGNAIKIDFSKLALFNTSSVGYNDVFRFYNGREANADNQIAELLDEPEIVKSTAADGSMTVTFKTVAGTTKAGWEAVVSQFLPSDMTFSGVTAEADEGTTATVAAGDSGVRMLVIDVATDNQSNPLTLNGIALSTTTPDAITGYKVYYLGKKNSFSTTNQVAEGTVDGTSVAVTLEQALVEGHNWFAVVVDLPETLDNGTEVSLTAAGVTVGEASYEISPASTVTRTVANVCRATQGSHSHNIYGEWTFTNTEGSLGKYETPASGDADYIVTFVPQVENTVVEIDFSAFDVYYSSSSYGTRAVFEIYSGGSVNSANLLWQLNDASLASTGPGKVLRSTAADGSMTIRFNPKAYSSSYAGTGWTAAVRPFLNHPMTVENVTVAQTSSAILPVGAKDESLIDFNIVTEGTLSVATLEEAVFTVKGAEAIESLRLLYTGEGEDLENAAEFGTATVTEDGAVTISGSRDLAEGSNRFFLQVSVKNDADAEVAVDAALTSLTLNGAAMAIENGDPAGERVTKSMLLMQSGKQVVTIVKPVMFYDDGGPDEKFSKGFDGTITFLPGRDNCGIELITHSFALGSQSYNKFFVYEGQEVNADKSRGQFSTTNGPNLISYADDGSITITFTTSSSSYSSALDGFEIEVKLHEYEALRVDNVTTDLATDGSLVRSVKDVPLVKTTLDVVNDNEEVSLNNFRVDLTGTTNLSDLEALRLYYTASTPNFSTTNKVAEVTEITGTEVTFTLAEPIEITKSGTYHLWLAGDIAAAATPGNTVALALTGFDGTDEETTYDTGIMSYDIKAGFKGTYIIGASAEADFATFADAITAMSGGVEGAVRFEVEDGTYAENIQFGNIAGAGENNPITFIGKSGDREKVIVTGAGSTTTFPMGTTEYKKGMVFVENTPYVTFEKMSFIPARESEYSYVVHVFDRSRHFTLRDCHVKATPVTSGYSGLNMVFTQAYNEDGRNNDYATIEDNLVEGGYIGLYLGGTSTFAYTKERGLVARGNTIMENCSKAIYVMDEVDGTIENNTILQTTVARTGYWGIDLFRNRGAVTVAGNKITNTTTYYNGGIELRQESWGDDAAPIRVYNNVVAITQSSSTSTVGIQVNGDSKNVEVVNNSVRIGGSKGYAYYSGNGSYYTGITLRNNLFRNETESPLMFVYSTLTDKAVFDNNDFSAAGGNILADTDLAAFNAKENVTATIDEAPVFVNESNLHLLEAGNLRVAVPVDYITVDADGVERNATTPTLGAYEFAVIEDNKPEVAEGYPSVGTVTDNSAVVLTKWSEAGKLYSKIEKVEAVDPSGTRLKGATADDLMLTDPVDILADTEVSTTFDNLDLESDYVASFIAVNDLGTPSDIVTVNLTTERHIDALTLTVVGDTIEAGETATLTATIGGGDEPYTIEWRDQMNTVVGTGATIEVEPTQSYMYRVSVTSADGQQATGKAAAIVRGDAVVATFDDNYLADETFFNGDNYDDTFYSGSYSFHVGNAIWPGTTTSFWYDYALSNQTSNAFSGLDDQYHSAPGGAYEGNNFVIAFPQGGSIGVTHDAAGDVISGFYIANTAYALNALKGGDSYAREMKEGDWFKVTAKDVDNDNNTLDFYLSDFRSANAADRYNVESWEWFDLTPLGNVKGVTFAFSGTDIGQYGLNTPAYFAMDNFGGEPAMSEEERVIKVFPAANVHLDDMFEYLQDGSTVTYALSGTLTGDDMDIVLDSDNNRLVVNAKQDGAQRTIVVAMTQKGHTQRVRLTIKIDNITGIDGLAADKTVQRVTYVNAMGVESDTPWHGVNIVVTRYTDGTAVTTKVIK